MLFATMNFMRLVIQRVKKAKVIVTDTKKVAGEIDRGYLVLVGVKEGDTQDDAQILAEKLVKLRIMADEAGKMNLSIKDAKGKILAVSQFTLHADTSKGNRPSFIKAAKPDLAEKVYQYFVSELKKLEVEVETGEFGAYMNISAELDGPVTIIIEN